MRILVGSVGVTLVVAGCSGTADDPAPTTVAITTSVATTVATTPTTAPASTTTTVPPTTTSVAPTTTTTAPDSNPPGWDTWTLIYASLATGEHTRNDAEAIASGVENSGVLLSDDYPSLNPGYWVVYAGSWGDRHQAGIWCPKPLDPNLTCYPRYLGPSIPTLLNDGAALAQIEGWLVALEVETGEVLATFSDNFYWEAYAGSFALTATSERLYFEVWSEDAWYSCESDNGQIRRLDLGSGIEDSLGDGWSPAISPDGRWLAIVAASKCYPDPEVAGWVVSPGNEVKLYDLSDGDFVVDRVLRTGMPETYDDPRGVRRVGWDPTSDRDLLVWLADGSVRRIAYDSGSDLTSAEVFWASEVGEFAAASTSHTYVIEGMGDGSAVVVSSRSSGDLVDVYEVDGWITGLSVGRSGDVIITTWEYMILPNGKRIAIAGGINNLAW